MNRSNNTWVKNMYQKLEDIRTDIDKLVCKEPVAFVGNQMETVGANVKNFFSSFVDDFGLTLPSECINSVESSTNSVAEIKENTADSNTDNAKEGQSTDSRHSEQNTYEISHLICEKDSLINETSNNNTQVNLDRPVDELECDSNTSTAYQSSEPETLVTCNENQEENSKHIISSWLLSQNLCESVNSSFGHCTVEQDAIDCKPTESSETMDYFSVASDILSSCGSFTGVDCDSNSEAAYASCSETGSTDGSMVDYEDVKYDVVESGVIFAGEKHSLCPKTPRSKSYKKMIQGFFKSRKRLTKEYKQLAVLHGDIDKQLCQPTAKDLPDSEWELL